MVIGQILPKFDKTEIMEPIVFIDDDADDQEIMIDLCKELRPQYPIRSFFSGQDALSYFKITEERPMLIFCDLNMPGMTGLELLRLVQDTPHLKSKAIPFVCLSTANDPRYISEVYSLGVQGFFEKPTSIESFRDIFDLTIRFWEKCLHPKRGT